jgi:hypothetical protein
MTKAGRLKGWKAERKESAGTGIPKLLYLPTFVVGFPDPPSNADPAILAESVQQLTRVKHGRARFSIT